jgi:hypothetical protein
VLGLVVVNTSTATRPPADSLLVFKVVDSESESVWFAPTGGDLCPEHKTENELSLKYGYRRMSIYPITDMEKIWVINEAERSVTIM